MWVVLSICSRINNSWTDKSSADESWKSRKSTGYCSAGRKKPFKYILQRLHVWHVLPKRRHCPSKTTTRNLECLIWVQGVCQLFLSQYWFWNSFASEAFWQGSPKTRVLKTLLDNCLTFCCPAVLCSLHPVFRHMAKCFLKFMDMSPIGDIGLSRRPSWLIWGWRSGHLRSHRTLLRRTCFSYRGKKNYVLMSVLKSSCFNLQWVSSEVEVDMTLQTATPSLTEL